MARCSGCSGDRCSCIIRAGANARVDGVGTAENPYVISLEGSSGGGGEPGGSQWEPGDLKMAAYATAKAGWLLANGQAVSRTTFAVLFAAIGTAYGAGDGSTTFNLPNFSDTFPLGVGPLHVRGSRGGRETMTLTVNQLPSHNHTIAHTHTINHTHPSGTTEGANRDHTHSGSTNTAYTAGPGQVVVGGVGTQAASNHFVGYGPAATVPLGYPAEIPGGNHVHNFQTGGFSHQHQHQFFTPSYEGSSGPNNNQYSGNTGSGASINIMPPWTAVTFFIKT